jgi:hypothetical protein
MVATKTFVLSKEEREKTVGLNTIPLHLLALSSSFHLLFYLQLHLPHNFDLFIRLEQLSSSRELPLVLPHQVQEAISIIIIMFITSFIVYSCISSY